MKCYKLILNSIDNSNKTNFIEIRYFMKKDIAEKVNLELQNFLFQNPRTPYIKQVLREYPNLISSYKKIENLNSAQQIKLELLEMQIEKYLEFVSTWPENTQMDLLHFFSRNMCISEVVEFEIEE